ncbi:MAG: DUF1800 domain-containing protein [Bacteroidota bacterium]|nr:DUF1800 domain-containing protein [Candidatus Kapabacteria bacterium]MDW8272417.1 DUF1800 domain-containing protein [Bacteroidota bacterium]
MGALDRYIGPWDERRAGHLLRRATFLNSRRFARQLLEMGLDAAVDHLLANQPMPDPPKDPTTGEDFVNSQTPLQNDGQYFTILKGWWLEQMLRTDRLSIVEKMTLFWHNFFATELMVIADARFAYHHNAKLRRYALGNIQELTRQITIDPGMLRYLNGDQNTAQKPNENYARELFELFTIGKGPERADGDYTNYTERDVQEAARVLTGWRIQRRGDPSISVYNVALHDRGDKQFSSAFGNRVIHGRSTPEGGLEEINELLDMIFAQPETARFYVRKLYRWFVFYDIDQQTEQEVIEPLAQLLRQSNYEVKPVLRVLLKSQRFFDEQNIGAMIKSPLDFIVQLFTAVGFTLPTGLQEKRRILTSLVTQAILQQQDPMDPPSVAGWPAYYQTPDYYRFWINSATLSARYALTDAVVMGGNALPRRYVLDVLGFAEKVSSNPGDYRQLVDDLVEELLPAYPPSDQQRDHLARNVLMAGGQVYEWGQIWSAYKANPNNPTARGAAQQRLQSLIRAIFRMAEYQLM